MYAIDATSVSFPWKCVSLLFLVCVIPWKVVSLTPVFEINPEHYLSLCITKYFVSDTDSWLLATFSSKSDHLGQLMIQPACVTCIFASYVVYKNN